jgi:hypothetical protein
MDSFPPRYRSTPIAVILAVFLFNTPGSTADAPVVTQERVVALTESVGYQIDPLERERYGLFPQRMGFLLAEFLLRDGTYWLRLSFRSGSERIVEQSQLTDAQFLAWRQSVLAIDQGRTAAPLALLSDTDRRDGRLRMVTDVFLYGLWLYGPATISVFDVDSDRGVTAIELLAGGGAFAGALSKTQDYRLGYARTTLVRWGNYAGTFYGFGIPALLHTDNGRVYALSAMAATPAGGYLAYRLSDGRRFGKGEADLITTGAWVGALYGLAVPYLAFADGDYGRLYLASSMAGVPAGALLTERLLRGRRLNRGRAHLITLGGFMGAAEALGVVYLVDDDAPERAYVWAACVGAPVGAWIGYRATDGRRHSLGRARMISVGTYAGGIAGQGVVVSLDLGGRARTLSGMVGSIMGLWFTDRLTDDWGQDVTTGSSPEGLRVELPSPAALFTLGAAAARGPARTPLPPVQLLRISF